MLQELFLIIQDRKQRRPSGSYTWELMEAGEDSMLQKIGEEAVEVILAGKGQGKARLVEEIADLFYHTLVLISANNLTLEDVEEELRRRHLQKSS